MIVRGHETVLVQGITGRQGTFWTERMQAYGTKVVGGVNPKKAGIEHCGVPAFNARVFQPGRVGVVSRSGSLGTLVCLNLVSAGFGISAFIGIGGDPVLGTTIAEALVALERDRGTDSVVIVGEIGGAMEEAAADYAKNMDKPVVAFIAGAAAPPGKRMGHAGAIVLGDKGTFAAKRAALEAAGATVVATPTEIGPALKARMG